MSVQVIPTDTDPFYTQETSLDGVRYSLEFRYSQREKVWYLSIGLPDGTELASGIKVVCNFSLLKYRADVRLPPGLLVAVSSTPDDSPPGLDELGEDARVSLIYTPFADLATL